MTTTSPTPLALLDINVLLALVNARHVHHQQAHAAFARTESGWATTPVTETGFVRLMLTPAVTGLELSAADVLGALNSIRSHPGWHWLPDDVSPTDDHITMQVLGGRRQVTDLHLVALAARHNAKLWTFDAALPRILTPTDREHVHLLPH